MNLNFLKSDLPLLLFEEIFVGIFKSLYIFGVTLLLKNNLQNSKTVSTKVSLAKLFFGVHFKEYAHENVSLQIIQVKEESYTVVKICVFLCLRKHG